MALACGFDKKSIILNQSILEPKTFLLWQLLFFKLTTSRHDKLIKTNNCFNSLLLQIELKENQVALEHQAALDQHQQMAMVAKTEDRRRVLESFPFSGEEQPSSVLPQVPPLFNPYRLQPTQPNLQDFSLQLPDYGTSMSS